MGSRTYSTERSTDTSVTATTETQAVLVSGVTTVRAGTKVLISAHVQMTVGTGGTAVTPRVRRGSDQTGTVVNEANAVTATAANVIDLDVMCEDTPGEVAGQEYELTVQQTAATAAGTVSFATMSVEAKR